MKGDSCQCRSPDPLIARVYAISSIQLVVDRERSSFLYLLKVVVLRCVGRNVQSLRCVYG